MKNLLKTLGILLVTGGVVALVATSVSGQDASFRRLMGENMNHLQKIMVSMVNSQYEGVPADVRVIAQHAQDLTQRIPSHVRGPEARNRFLAYANNLGSVSNNLVVVVEELLRHDQTQQNPGQMNIDYLRVAAASHLGEMITTCVACHNQFRR